MSTILDMPEILMENHRKDHERKENEYLAMKYGKELQDFLNYEFGEEYQVSIRLTNLDMKVPLNSSYEILVKSLIYEIEGDHLMYVGEPYVVKSLTSSNYATKIKLIMKMIEESYESELRKISKEQDTSDNRGERRETSSEKVNGENGTILSFTPKA